MLLLLQLLLLLLLHLLFGDVVDETEQSDGRLAVGAGVGIEAGATDEGRGMVQ